MVLGKQLGLFIWIKLGFRFQLHFVHALNSLDLRFFFSTMKIITAYL